MKKSLAIAIATVTATLVSALSLGMSQPVEAQTRCRWEGRQMRCQNERDINNRYDYYNRNRNDYYYNRGRNNPSHTDGGYYEEWRRNNHSRNNDGGYYEEWRRNNYSYNNGYNNRYYNNRSYNNGYYNNRVINESELRRSINEIYRQQLGRNADWDGIRHYTNQYRNGWSLGQIRNDIANSKEAYYRRY
jgi:hypothetical protein